MVMTAFAQVEKPGPGFVCVEVIKYEKKECRKNTLGRAAGGAVIGGVAGYLLGGKKTAKWGALAGGATGAATSEETCTITPVEYCNKWEAPQIQKRVK